MGCHFLLWGDLPNPEIELASPTLPGGVFTTEPAGKPHTELLKLIKKHAKMDKTTETSITQKKIQEWSVDLSTPAQPH